VASGEIANRFKQDPAYFAVHVPDTVPSQGALPINIGEEVIGAVDVSGAPGGDKDEACAKAGLDKVPQGVLDMLSIPRLALAT
jgi:uncharacterized protein GlcG (DUF336 family)